MVQIFYKNLFESSHLGFFKMWCSQPKPMVFFNFQIKISRKQRNWWQDTRWRESCLIKLTMYFELDKNNFQHKCKLISRWDFYPADGQLLPFTLMCYPNNNYGQQLCPTANRMNMKGDLCNRFFNLLLYQKC